MFSLHLGYLSPFLRQILPLQIFDLLYELCFLTDQKVSHTLFQEHVLDLDLLIKDSSKKKLVWEDIKKANREIDNEK